MKQRQLLELQSWFLASLVLSASVLVPAYASPRPQTHSGRITDPYRRITDYDYFDSSSPEDTAGLVVGSARQDDFSSIGSLISLGIKVFPLVMQAVNAFSGSGSSSSSDSSSSSSSTVDRVETAAAVSAAVFTCTGRLARQLQTHPSRASILWRLYPNDLKFFCIPPNLQLNETLVDLDW